MRRLAYWIARLYPASWRARYGDEFHALLDDARLRWTDLFDMFFSALRLQRVPPLITACSLAGLMLGGIVMLQSRPAYVASGQTSPESALNIPFLWTRGALAEVIIQNDLYRRELWRMPMEDVIERMRRDISISRSGGPMTVRIQFRYQEPERAQKTILSLMRLLESPAGINPAVEREPRPFDPVLWGLATGLCCGCAFAICIRKSPRWVIQVTAGGLLGAAVALAVAALIPSRYESSAVVQADPALVQSTLKSTGVQIRTIAANLFVISYTHTSPQEAHAFVRDVLGNLRRRSWETHQQIVSMRVLDGASLPQSPFYPNRYTLAGIGLAAGILIGALTAPKSVASISASN